MQTQEPINSEMQEQDTPQASTDLIPQKDYFSIALSSILGGATALTQNVFLCEYEYSEISV